MKIEEQRAPYAASISVEWPVVPFEQVATPQSDRGKRIKQRDYLPEGRIPVIDQGQAPVGGYTNDDDFAFSGELPVVLFGDHTRAVKLVDHCFAVGADGIKIFRPTEGVRPKYLYYWMKSARIPDRGYGRHYQYLRQLSVPLPPPSKQDEIVAEIEKQFSRLDEAVANLKRVKANLKRYKAAVLKAAVEGRLVETEAELARREGRSYETGTQLLQLILETRRSQWKGKGKYKEPAAPVTAGLPELPEGWVWANVEQLTWLVTSGSRGWGDFYSDTGVLFIRAQDIKTDVLNIRGVARVNIPADAEGTRSSVSCQDILVTITGANVTKSALVPPLEEVAFVSQHVALLKLNLPEIAPFVFSWIVSPSNGRKILEAWAYGAGKPGLSLEQIRSLPVALPPISEQRQINTEVDRSLSLADEAVAQINANLQRAERLRQSILATAFTPPVKEFAKPTLYANREQRPAS